MTKALQDKVAIVTGGAQGIGSAIAGALQEAGAKVVVGDVQTNTAAQFDVRHLDVTDENAIKAFVDQVKEDYGGVDTLVNNAGIMFEKHVFEQSAEDWDRMMAINLRGPVLMAKHAATAMAERGGGTIVNIGSIEGFACNPGHTAYAASKAGVHGLTIALAVDLGPRGIRCNTIAPGWIDTELNKAYVDSHPDRDLVVAELAKLHPVGHIGAPEDIGNVAVWLASDASRFVTGQQITVDGGRTSRPSLPSIMGR